MLSKLLDTISQLGENTISFCRSIGRATLMLWGALVAKPQPIKNAPLLIKQLYSVGVQSLAIIIVSGLFIGMVLSFRGM